MNKKRFVILDRDGTIIIEKNYLSNPEHVKLIPGAANALKEIKKLGFGLLVITNQSGVGRKYFDLDTLSKIHKRLIDLLLEEGVVLDDIYFCPHIPEDDCLCRKPKIELIKQAMKEHKFDSKSCFVVGDNKGDIEMGKKIGSITILVRTGYGKKIESEGIGVDFVVDSLKDIVQIIKTN
jgi:D-glycero-D-manno-heptose 1,7-bisphosphate phosphatase